MTVTDDQIELAARIVKIVKLASNPMMDAVAIKLNSGPTYEEIQQAKFWARAFQYAQEGGKAFDLAAKMMKPK